MNEKIRILYVLSTVTGGGVERRRLSLAKYLDKDKFTFKMIGTFKSGDVARQIEENKMQIIPIGHFNGPLHWSQHKKVQQVISEFKPHIIHGGVFEGVTMAAINGFIKKVPIVIIEETSDPKNRSWRGDLLMYIFGKIAHKVIAISPNVATYLNKRAKINTDKIITINNGVAIPREVSAQEVTQLKQQLGIMPDDYVVGSVGRISNDHKRFTDIIEAVALLSNKSIKLLIVGNGRDKAILEAKAAELGITAQLILTGYQYDTAPYYELMDLFCIVSQREGFGLVAAEAMLHHLPVIATKVGGLQDIVQDGVNGYLITPKAPDELAEKINYLYQNPQITDRMAATGYEQAMEKYTEKRYVQEVAQLYLELLNKKGLNR